MNKFAELKQAPDDSWTIESLQDNGLSKVVVLPSLSKEQAIREALRLGYKRIRCWDKQIMKAMANGALFIE